MNQEKLKIGIIAATVWEMRAFIRKLGMNRKDRDHFESHFPRSSVYLQISGIGQNRARQAAEKISSFFPSLVISTGFCGALKTGIEAGDIVLDIEKSNPERISQLVQSAERNRIKIIQGKFLNVDHALLDKNEKLRLGMETGATAVEMESEAIEQVCKDKQIPFYSFRAVSDTVNQNQPSLVTAIDPQGQLGLHFLKKLFFHPSEWFSFSRLALSSKKAENSLARILIQLIEDCSKGE